MVRTIITWFLKVVVMVLFWIVTLGFLLPALFSAPASTAIVAGLIYFVFFGVVNILFGAHIFHSIKGVFDETE